MILDFHIPVYPLSDFIESFVYYKDYQPDHRYDRLLPDGNVYIIIDLTDAPKYLYDNHSLKAIQTCRKIWFSGLQNQFITIPSGRDSEMFVINFRKGRAQPFINMPLSAATDAIVDGEDVFSADLFCMRDALREQDTVAKKFCCAEYFLLKTFKSKLQLNPFIDYAVGQVLRNPHQLTIEKLSNKIGFSHKHFISLFKSHVGVTPKSFLKIIRFQKAVEEIGNASFSNWSSVALESGYYDQAHFINDFKNFSGYTPSEYLLMHKVFTNYVALD